MKLQIPKVATIAIIAFIGIGFAGTQQAKAAPCNPEEPVDRLTCGDTTNEEVEYNPRGGDPLVCERPTRTTNGFGGCWDTNGNCFAETFYGARVEESRCTNTETGVTQNCDFVVFTVLGECVN